MHYQRQHNNVKNFHLADCIAGRRAEKCDSYPCIRVQAPFPTLSYCDTSCDFGHSTLPSVHFRRYPCPLAFPPVLLNSQRRRHAVIIPSASIRHPYSGACAVTSVFCEAPERAERFCIAFLFAHLGVPTARHGTPGAV